MNFSSDAMADFEGLLEVNRKICKQQMAEKASPTLPTNCAVLPKEIEVRETPGEAASLREAPPPDPLPKSSWRLNWLLLRRWFRLSVGRSPIGLVVVTAADRAAVTCLGRERQKGSNDRTVVGAFLYRKENATSPRRLCQPPWTRTTCKEPRPTLRRNQLRRNTQLKRQPLFGREGAGGRGASLREAASPPSSVPHPTSHGEGARGRGLLYREAPSLAKPIIPLYIQL